MTRRNARTSSYPALLWTLAWSLLLAPVVGLSTGCTSDPVVTTRGVSVVYVNGEASGTVPAGVDQLKQATQDVFRSLEIGETGDWVDSDGRTRVTGKTVPRGQRVTVTLSPQSEALTSMRVRVGTFGEEALSIVVFERIVEAADVQPPAPAEPEAEDAS